MSNMKSLTIPRVGNYSSQVARGGSAYYYLTKYIFFTKFTPAESSTKRPTVTFQTLCARGDINKNTKKIKDIDLKKIKPLKIFKWLKSKNISNQEMMRTFNCGVGFCLITDKTTLKSNDKTMWICVILIPMCSRTMAG